MKWTPDNNKMQLTRPGHPRWRPSQLILVLDDSAMEPEVAVRQAIQQYERGMSVLASADCDALETLAAELDGFPEGVDPYLGRRWVINAIGSGSQASVEWMLGRAVELNFRDEEGYTPLHAALERDRDDRYILLGALLDAGAPVNLKGINDWTPAHMAAAQDDVEALRVLVQHGADLAIRTEIDDYATPLEEARNLGTVNAVRYLESVV